MTEQKQITGDNIIHALDFFKQKKGTEGLNELDAEVEFDIKNVYEERWYPIENYIQLLEKFDKKFEYKEYSISFRIGFDRSRRIGLLNNNNGKINPKLALGKVQENWWRYNNFGSVELKEIDENHLNIYICENINHALYCERMRGFFAGVLREICNQEEPKVKKTKCVSNGEKYCKFEASWKIDNGLPR